MSRRSTSPTVVQNFTLPYCNLRADMVDRYPRATSTNWKDLRVKERMSQQHTYFTILHTPTVCLFSVTYRTPNT